MPPLTIPNDLLRLRFFGDGDEPVAVESRVLSAILEDLRAVVEAAVAVTRSEVRRHDLAFVAPPRSGSLEFLLAPHLEITVNLQGFVYAVGSEAIELAGEVRDWAMFFYTLAFGGVGLVQIAKGLAKMKAVPIAEAKAAARDAEHPASLMIGLSYTAIGRVPVQRAIVQLMADAERAGFRRIEVEIRDEGPVVLHDMSETKEGRRFEIRETTSPPPKARRLRRNTSGRAAAAEPTSEPASAPAAATDAPTVTDLEVAEAELRRLQAAWENYSGNNPNKYQTRIGEAARKVRELRRALKAAGALARTPHEALEAELDALHPNARSKDIVEHDGERYQLRFRPLQKSLSGKTVKEWDRAWAKLPSR